MLEYSKHLRKRMLQRGLTEQMIQDTVRHPDETRPTYRKRYLARKHFYGKILEVVCLPMKDRTILITAYWDEERG